MTYGSRVYWIVCYIISSIPALGALTFGLILALIVVLTLPACAPLQPATASQSVPSDGTPTEVIPARLQALLSAEVPTHVILLGEQHDNPDHQRIERDVVAALAAQGRLAALVIEMAGQGQSTAPHQPFATPTEIKAALQWDDKAWSWDAYAPVIMAAVKAGVAVVGANLPRAQMRGAMADAALDARLDAAALQSQRDSIREGHCGLLPESQIGPMTRVQIARDVAMATVAVQLVKKADAPAALPRYVLLIAGNGHVDAALGVSRHWPAGVASKSVLLGSPADANRSSPDGQPPGFDAVWPTQSIPPKDYCAELKKSMGR